MILLDSFLKEFRWNIEIKEQFIYLSWKNICGLNSKNIFLENWISIENSTRFSDQGFFSFLRST